jgi:AcrR family transcriptional regulator
MPAAKTKTREPLSIPLIHNTALEAINRDGLEALSMRSLAKTLNVDPMAIYHHIPNKAALLSGIYEGVIAELFAEPSLETSWQAQLKYLMRRFRSLATRSPNIFPGLIASTHTSPGMARAIDTILGILLEAGLSPKLTVQTGDAVFAFATGFVLLELNHIASGADASAHDIAIAMPLAHESIFRKFRVRLAIFDSRDRSEFEGNSSQKQKALTHQLNLEPNSCGSNSNLEKSIGGFAGARPPVMTARFGLIAAGAHVMPTSRVVLGRVHKVHRATRIFATPNAVWNVQQLLKQILGRQPSGSPDILDTNGFFDPVWSELANAAAALENVVQRPASPKVIAVIQDPTHGCACFDQRGTYRFDPRSAKCQPLVLKPRQSALRGLERIAMSGHPNQPFGIDKPNRQRIGFRGDIGELRIVHRGPWI